MKCGIIGLPNAGKSTLFNCLTSLNAPAENYPFCTVDPNRGTVCVPDKRLDELGHIFKPDKITPATMEFVDIAGLIPGAHKGEGLGNRFLSHIRETQALIHVVRAFVDGNIIHTQGNVDPLRDIQLVETELILADLEFLQKREEKLIKLSKGTNPKEMKLELSLLHKLKDGLNKEQPARLYPLAETEKPYFQQWPLLTAKPCLYVLNQAGLEIPVTEEAFPSSGPDLEHEFSNKMSINTGEEHMETKNNSAIKAVQDKYGFVMCVSARVESEIAHLPSEEEKQEFLSALGWQEPGLNRLILCSYKLLNLISFFTAGPKEVRAYALRKGNLAPEAAGKVHSDFQKGFIGVDVYSFEDMQRAGSEKALKERGLYRQEGKNYVVKDGDVMLFRFNV